MKSLPEVQQEFLTTAYRLVLPETLLVGVACVLFLLGLVVPRRLPTVALAMGGVIGAGIVAAIVGGQEVNHFWKIIEGTQYHPRTISPFDPTGPAAFVRWLVLISTGLYLLISWSEMRDDNAAEYTACVLVMSAGASLVGRANDLVSLFLALELVSIPTYVLLYLPVRSKPGQEAALKYFLLSILSSAIMLFGFSYLYGITGTTNIGAMNQTLSSANQLSASPLALVAAFMVIAGIGFRITAFPFHWYAPDVYEGGPTGVVAQLAFIPKVVGFLALARLLGMLDPPSARLPFDANSTIIPLLLWIVAAVTMTFGNLLALTQDNLRRLLAYSGVAHGGYMLLGIVAACSMPESTGSNPAQTGVDSLLFYLVAYGLMTVGAFAILQYLNGSEQSFETVDDISGLGRSHPVSATVLSVLLFSLIGLPLTAGFVGKLLLFVSAFDAPATGPMRSMYRILAVVAAVNAAIGAVYYLRLISVMYLRGTQKPATPFPVKTAQWVAIACAIATLAFGVYPKPLAEAAHSAAPFQNDQPKPATPVAHADSR